jgi:hypothetical protein
LEKAGRAGEVPLRLGTKLTLYLSLIIVIVLSGYGYVDILSRRDVLIRKMKAEVMSTGRTLAESLEDVSLPGGPLNFSQHLPFYSRVSILNSKGGVKKRGEHRK